MDPSSSDQDLTASVYALRHSVDYVKITIQFQVAPGKRY